jgi:SPP1 gp7 family putative phage head morphogenesis protein
VATGVFERGGEGMDNPGWLISAKGMEEVERMRRDDAFGAYMDMKKSAVLSVDGHYVPASDEDTDVERSDFMQDVTERLDGSLKASLREILSAMEYGYSVTNMPMWMLEDGPFSGKWAARALKTKDPANFRFKVDDFRNIEKLIHTNPATMQVEELDPEEFIVFTYRKEFNNPYGTSDCQRAWRAYNSKKWNLRMWDMYNERFAGGFLNITTSPRTPQEEHALAESFVETLSTPRSGFKHSDATTVELVEASGRGHEVYRETIADRNISMARAVLLPDLLGLSARDTGGSYALGKQQIENVFLWVINDLRDSIEETIMFEQFIKPHIDLNYGPSENGYPRYVLDPFTDEQKVFFITNTILATEKGVIKGDIEVENAVREALDLPKREEDEEEIEVTPEPEIVPEDEVPPPNIPTVDPRDVIDIKDIQKIDRESMSSDLMSTSPTRSPNMYEKKVNVKLIEGTMDTEAAAFTEVWADLFKTARNALITKVKKQQLVEQKDYKAVNQLSLVGKRDMGNALKDYMVNACYFGALGAQGEVTSNAGLSEPVAFKTETLAEIAALWAARGLVVSPKLKAAAALLKDEAFFITGVQSEKVLSSAKQIIFRGIRKGDVNWTATQLEKLFDGYIFKPAQAGNYVLGAGYHIDTIARTNFTSAMNQGRKVKFEDPDVADYVVAYSWSSILDSGTTPYCYSMDGRVFRKDELAGRMPPAHYNCRSFIVPVTEGEEFKFDTLVSDDKRGTGFCEECVH